MKNIKVEFTENQIIWLELILGRGFDGYFENNKKSRNLCDKCYKKIASAMDKLRYRTENPYFLNFLKEKELRE